MGANIHIILKEHNFFSPLAASKKGEVPLIFLNAEKDLKFRIYAHANLIFMFIQIKVFPNLKKKERPVVSFKIEVSCI